MLKKFFILAVVMINVSCGEDDKRSVFADGVEDIGGTWLLNEHGYSPGDRYITEPVPPVPPQTISFSANGRMSSNIAGMKEMKFYEIVTEQETHILIVYKTEEELITKPEQRQSYTIDFTEGDLRLSYRFCIEGCHMKFGKVKGTETDA